MKQITKSCSGQRGAKKQEFGSELMGTACDHVMYAEEMVINDTSTKLKEPQPTNMEPRRALGSGHTQSAPSPGKAA
jgi:hypothetical protein